MAIIELKACREPFDAVWRGVKHHEVRVNDRDFRIGDTLILKEWETDGHFYTGREIQAKVTYITDGGKWGLPDDMCILAIPQPIRSQPWGDGWRDESASDSDTEEDRPTVLPGDFVLCPSCKCEYPARLTCGECYSEGVVAAEKGSEEKS